MPSKEKQFFLPLHQDQVQIPFLLYYLLPSVTKQYDQIKENTQNCIVCYTWNTICLP